MHSAGSRRGAVDAVGAGRHGQHTAAAGSRERAQVSFGMLDGNEARAGRRGVSAVPHRLLLAMIKAGSGLLN